jgi:hypothetical protein
VNFVPDVFTKVSGVGVGTAVVVDVGAAPLVDGLGRHW